MITNRNDQEREDFNPTPFMAVSKILSGAWYAISITIVLVGVVIWLQNQYNDVRTLQRDMTQLRADMQNRDTEIQHAFTERARAVDQRFSDLDIHGTRALSDRMGQIEQTNKSQDERLQELVRRLNDMQVQLNKVTNDDTVVIERQNRVLERLKTLEDERRPHGP